MSYQIDSEQQQHKIVASELTELRNLLGMERRKSDMRQLGALLVILGIGSAFSALALTAVLVEGMTGFQEVVAGFRLPALCATTIQTGIGMVSMAVGFYTMLETPCSARAHQVAKILVGVVNLGPISFVITVIRLAEGATEPPETNEFIPYSLHPTKADIRFTVGMGILSLISVCATLIGGLTVVGLNLCAFLGGKPADKHKGYYAVRFGYYCIMVILGGVSQFLLGTYLWVRYGPGPYGEAVHVAVYTIFFPILAVLVGVVQTIYGAYGLARAAGWVKISQRNDQSFALLTCLAWAISMVLQCILQPSYGEGMLFDAEGATYAAVYLGFFVMPLWLDWLVRTTPPAVDPEYYGFPADTEMKEDVLCKVFGCTSGCCSLAMDAHFRKSSATQTMSGMISVSDRENSSRSTPRVM